MFRRRQFLLASIGAGFMDFGSARASSMASESIRRSLQLAVGAGDKVAGRVAVIVDERGESTTAVGSSGVPGVTMDEDTVFEIGSITKVLTGLILADMVTRGEVAFDDPVVEYLPPTMNLRERGRPITLLDLATYHSGLPNMPGNLPPQWWTNPNPFANYTKEQLGLFLSGYMPEYAPGSHYQYANLGFALLGMALAHRAGQSYEELLIGRVCDPLALSHTRIKLTADMRRHMAQGHSPETLKPASMWDMPALPGMGAVRSTARDLTVLLKASMGLTRTSLDAAFALLVKTRRRTSAEGTDVGLGWFISSSRTEEIVWKSGLTGGFSSFIGFSTLRHRGAILLSNGGYTAGAGFRLVNPDFNPGNLEMLLR
jgi:CubicO group peptidase (beta-lactamase class C family)